MKANIKLSTLIAVILTVSSLSVASVAVAQVDTSAKSNIQYKQHSRIHSPQHRFMRMFKSVDLTDEQQQQMQLLIQQHKADRNSQSASKQQYSDTKAAISQLMQADHFDQAQAEQLLQQRQVQQQQRQLQRLKLQYDLLQVLTPEQRQQLAKAKKQAQHKRVKHKQTRNTHNA
ncbi:Spy/CpxP family protein refolding chaperone [Rheinheimera salexigens]|uniref:Zinc resistance-associated protein n=1 Tax=Rheinheimera salexigens TaxID=1628148 RepID=A0A1E7Q454_9GAMM|nr:Spy/CpxP family protein refolding chaperone [Rheinheimera salexigens]OEY68974.1 hypothetical protein BI198_04870 [Rheinheimera salexigens]